MPGFAYACGSPLNENADFEHLFADVFAEQPETGIRVDVESIRFIGTNLAVEMGSTTQERLTPLA